MISFLGTVVVGFLALVCCLYRTSLISVIDNNSRVSILQHQLPPVHSDKSAKEKVMIMCGNNEN